MHGRYIYLESYLSRRLGVSTGINIIGPPKMCTYNCVYCEVGPTDPDHLVSPLFRWSTTFDTAEFQKELESALEMNPHLDSLTFGYYGEPTLSGFLNEALQIAIKVKHSFSRKDGGPSLTLLTNSSTFTEKNIRRNVSQFDWVVAKLDCARQSTFLSVNRPHQNVPPVDEIINALMLLNEEMKEVPEHRLSIQTLLLHSTNPEIQSNCTDADLSALCDAYQKIQPYSVQIYTVSREPAELDIHSISFEQKETIRKYLQNRLPKTISYRIF